MIPKSEDSFFGLISLEDGPERSLPLEADKTGDNEDSHSGIEWGLAEDLSLVDGPSPKLIGAAIRMEADAIQRWWQSGHPIDSIFALIWWNVLCKTVLRKPGRRVLPERLALAIKIAWLDYEDPVPTDVTLIGTKLGGKKQTWLDLVRDARSEVEKIVGPLFASGYLGVATTVWVSDANFYRKVDRAQKKGTYTSSVRHRITRKTRSAA